MAAQVQLTIPNRDQIIVNDGVIALRSQGQSVYCYAYPVSIFQQVRARQAGLLQLIRVSGDFGAGLNYIGADYWTTYQAGLGITGFNPFVFNGGYGVIFAPTEDAVGSEWIIGYAES